MFECLLSDIFQCSINIPVWLLLYRNIELKFSLNIIFQCSINIIGQCSINFAVLLLLYTNVERTFKQPFF